MILNLELRNYKYKYVKCFNNHIFCFFCLNKSHGYLSCDKIINKGLNEYANKNFLKNAQNEE